MKPRVNLLLITCGALVIGAFYLLLVNWVISVVLISIASILFIVNHLLRNKTNRINNIIAAFFWLIVVMVGYSFTKTTVIHVKGQPKKVFIITGEKDKPKIHSFWKWKNHVEVDTTNVLYTSSSLSQLRNIVLVNEVGDEISGYGKGVSTQRCLPNSSLISIQTKYYKHTFRIDTNDKGWDLSGYQRSKCK